MANVLKELMGPGQLDIGAQIAALHNWTLSRHIMGDCEPILGLQEAHYGTVSVVAGAVGAADDAIRAEVGGEHDEPMLRWGGVWV